jgi:hypothetical protein
MKKLVIQLIKREDVTIEQLINILNDALRYNTPYIKVTIEGDV